MRSPLTVIIGWLEVLRTGHFKPSDHEKIFANLYRNARLPAQLGDEQLDFSVNVKGKFECTIQPVDLRSVIMACIESVRLFAEAKEVSVFT